MIFDCWRRKKDEESAKANRSLEAVILCVKKMKMKMPLLIR